jgi:hypothetical protein
MKTFKYIKTAAVALANAGLLLPNSTALAANPAGIADSQATVATPVIQDVAITGGVLRGQVTDAQGVGVAKAAVSVWTSGRQVASTRTDADGKFSVANLRGGSYTVAAGNGGGVYRLWAENSAPPQARPGVLIVSRQDTQRAQSGGGGMINPTTVGLGLLGGIVAGGIISQQSSSGEGGSGS